MSEQLIACRNEVLRLSGMLRVSNTERNDAKKRIAELEGELEKERQAISDEQGTLEFNANRFLKMSIERGQRIAELEGALNEAQCDVRACDRDPEWQKRQDVLMERKGGGEQGNEMKKKITDKQRLDWIDHAGLLNVYDALSKVYWALPGKRVGIRLAIDAAMKEKE
jgi:hypothetical protein